MPASTLSCLLGLILSGLLATVPAHAVEGAHERPPGAGESYWGPIPAQTDSVRAAFVQPPKPVWATAVDVPYEIVAFPVGLLFDGIQAATLALDGGGVVYTVSRWLKPRELPYGVVLSVDAGGLAGFGAGATAVHDEFFGRDNRFRLGFKVTSTGNNRVVLGTHFNVGHADEVQFGSGYRVRPNARFFGIGPRASQENESKYTDELSWVGATYERHVSGSLSVETTVLYTGFGARSPGDPNDPGIASVFADDLPRGYGDRSDAFTFGLVLQSDTTERTGTPDGGALVRAGASYTLDTDGSHTEYVAYRGEVETFVPLWFDERALALRAFGSWIDPVGGGGVGDVPFQRLTFNDEPDLMRGYRDYRWRDRGMTVLTAEYRWPIWVSHGNGDLGLHMYLFDDVGQVFGEADEISLDNVRQSYGVGIRGAAWGHFIGRIELGFSEEETVFRLRADQVFQFQKGGLYHGRNPVPSR